jgi:hypothetical protein
MREDPKFREAVTAIERARPGECYQTLLKNARAGDSKAASLFLSNYHRSRGMKYGREFKERLVALQERFANLAAGNGASPHSGEAGLAALIKSDFDEYMRLWDRVRSGADLTHEEVFRYGQLSVEIERGEFAAMRARGVNGLVMGRLSLDHFDINENESPEG